MCYKKRLLANCERMCEIAQETEACADPALCGHSDQSRATSDGGMIPQEMLDAGPCPFGHPEVHAETG